MSPRIPPSISTSSQVRSQAPASLDALADLLTPRPNGFFKNALARNRPLTPEQTSGFLKLQDTIKGMANAMQARPALYRIYADVPRFLEQHRTEATLKRPAAELGRDVHDWVVDADLKFSDHLEDLARRGESPEIVAAGWAQLQHSPISYIRERANRRDGIDESPPPQPALSAPAQPLVRPSRSHTAPKELGAPPPLDTQTIAKVTHLWPEPTREPFATTFALRPGTMLPTMRRMVLADLQKHGVTQPRVRFNEAAGSVEFGYSLQELRALIPQTLKQFVPGFVEGTRSLLDEPHSMVHDAQGALAPATVNGHVLSAVEQLVNQAELAFRTPAPARPVPAAIKPGRSAEMLTQIMGEHRGLVVGAAHDDPNPKALLSQSMQSFAQAGVTTLYLEHLTSPMQGRLLDAFHAAPPGSPMPKELAVYLKQMDADLHVPAGPGSFYGLVQAAQAHGIRVVAFENDVSSQCRSDDAMLDRLSTVNHLAHSAIAQQGAGRWLALVGTWHAHTATLQGDLQVPGLAELTGAPAVVIDRQSGASAGHGTLRTRQAIEDEPESGNAVLIEHQLLLPQHADARTPVRLA